LNTQQLSDDTATESILGELKHTATVRQLPT